mmetsp:Transcript_21152/g.63133  ORF Transcript_21152/g.63133 Transcript_21152/m.63133 type:complete len:191 (-) Transcript_21152:44-616(-)
MLLRSHKLWAALAAALALALGAPRAKPYVVNALGRFFRDVARAKARRRRYGARYPLATMVLGIEESVDLATPPTDATVTRAELEAADGFDGAPLWLGIRGRVYDVTASAGSFYGPGKPYNHFVGTDASRAFALGCKEERCVSDDLAGLAAAELRELDRWMEMYATHDKYQFVGTLVEDPVDEVLARDELE